MTNSDDIWIETLTAGADAKYYSMATVHYPYGMSGPGEMRVRFNLSAYVRDQIAAALTGEQRCAKCGEPTKSEEAWVDGQIWCHPCADAATGDLEGGK